MSAICLISVVTSDDSSTIKHREEALSPETAPEKPHEKMAVTLLVKNECSLPTKDVSMQQRWLKKAWEVILPYTQLHYVK